MLQQFLTDRGFVVARLNGSMDMEERRRAQDAFAEEARGLISTDAGGEGLNLQFCHAVINYDIPWNPMRLEQRIGRVDRIGQVHTVRAINFVFQDSVEHRVLEVLEGKLAIILDEFGIDKASDVLDSAQAGQIFEDLYVEAILHPETLDSTVESVVSRIKAQTKEARESVSVLGATEDLDPGDAQRVMSHPLPHWIECMTVSYLGGYGGRAEKRGQVWDLTWPDGERLSNVVFSIKSAEEMLTARHLTLEDPRVRGIAMRLPRFVPGQPISRVTLPDLPAEVRGFWSLWRITIHSDDWNRQRIMPLFLHDDGRCLMPAARYIWDQLLTVLPETHGYIGGEEASFVHARMTEVAERQGRSIYDELLQKHQERLAKEREKGEYAFTARRRVIERIGLPAVRNHRLAQLTAEERSWRDKLAEMAQVSPELLPLLLIRLDGDVAHG
jgi:hypothetical protein